MKKGTKIAALLLSAVMAGGLMACGNENKNADINADYRPFDEAARVEDARALTPERYSVRNISGTDDFGRNILSVDGKKDGDRYVGMFYFLTLGQESNHRGIYDIDQITEQGSNYEAFTDVDDSSTPAGAAHFWGEPVWGYYNSLDPWVMRKQIEMFTMAKIDFLAFDVSNNHLYLNVLNVLFPIMQEYYDKGWDVPKTVFYLGKHVGAGGDIGADMNAIKSLYNAYYKDGSYSDLYFAPEGKPMIVAPDTTIERCRTSSDSTEKAIYERFDFRVTQWPIDPPVNDTVYDNGAPWIDFTLPQTSIDGWINVSIAQHVTVNMTDRENSRGRGWTPSKKVAGKWYGVNDHENWEQGANYQAQWNTVLEMTDEQKAERAKYTFITGWNEWVAEKIKGNNGKYFTVDTFNAEYSRDIEPSRSGNMKDNFYLQTVQNIHADNYTAAKHYKLPRLSPDISTDDSAVWSKATAVYRDFTGECVKRDFRPMAGLENYVDTTNRNDIDTVQVTHDDKYMYFRVTCVDDITERSESDTGWMNIWLKTANGAGDMLNGYNYVINRKTSGNVTSVMRCKSSTDITEVGTGDVCVFGKTMIVRVPLSVLGLSENNYTLEFKVTDNVKNIERDILNMYTTGDCAPCGRLNFVYGY